MNKINNNNSNIKRIVYGIVKPFLKIYITKYGIKVKKAITKTMVLTILPFFFFSLVIIHHHYNYILVLVIYKLNIKEIYGI